MTDKELKKLNRLELLEILVEQSKEIDQLRKEVEKLRLDGASLRQTLSNVDSVIEVAMKINDAFSQAQKMSEKYLQSISFASKGQAVRNTQDVNNSKSFISDIITGEPPKATRPEGKRKFEDDIDERIKEILKR